MSSKGSDAVWLTEEEQRAWRAYRRMRTMLDLQLARDLAADSGLSEADYDVLSTLSERDSHEWRSGELAQRLSWSTSRLTHHTKRMAERGLLSRSPCTDDARGSLLRLSELGWRTLREAAPAHVRSVRQHFVGRLSDDEIRVLLLVAERVCAHLDVTKS